MNMELREQEMIIARIQEEIKNSAEMMDRGESHISTIEYLQSALEQVKKELSDDVEMTIYHWGI